jgi:hypothetical protein
MRRVFYFLPACVSLIFITAACSPIDVPSVPKDDTVAEDDSVAEDDPVTPVPLSAQACVDSGWNRALFKIDGIDRKLMWKAPAGAWTAGTILIFHGGGGKADDFCTGGSLVQPQIDFTTLALQNGFAVFALDATTNIVTDESNRPCGKRFDFAIVNRSNIDLPYVEHVLTSLVPSNRPVGSNQKIFLTGLSTGGYMTVRASTHFDGLIAAFAPVAAGDPYGTDPICDPSLSPRDSAVGILVDRETDREIVEDNSCVAASYPNESPWESQNPSTKPGFKQFHHQKDGIVDFSCAQKANLNINAAGYTDHGAFVLNAAGTKNVLYHLWLNAYNQPLIDFFKSQ